MSLSTTEIYEKVSQVLQDALAVDEDEISPEATLTEDLGAESIDFLDIVFQLEKTFDVKIDQSEMFPNDVLQNPDYVQDGMVTDRGMEELKQKLPHADLSEFDSSRAVEEFSKVFTVQTVVKFMERKLS